MSDENSNGNQNNAHPVKDALKDWGIDVEQFEARAKQSMETAKGDLSEIAGTLRESLHRAKDVVVDLQKGGVAPAASELKHGFERAWAEIEAAFASARQKAREARQGATNAEAATTADAPTNAPDTPATANTPPPDDPSI